MCVCVCEESDRGREIQKIEGQTDLGSIAWKTPKVSKTREIFFFFFNMLANTSLEAPGQDLFYQTVSAISRNVA